ncbi:hypothetical protein [Psychrobacter sp. UBA3480]|uniref:hypothetical protein n=1 Tax=Psychrobacter sp. UBA3480 TaxID=1947350 RepID=UPI0025EECCA5|nr:hypothetical protein [Psychrobacter sp. UBA3480]
MSHINHPSFLGKEKVSEKPILIGHLFKDVKFRHNGWVQGNTLYKGFFEHGKVKIWINRHISLSRDEISMGLRHPREFASFSANEILKIVYKDVNIRDFTIEQLEHLVKKNDNLAKLSDAEKMVLRSDCIMYEKILTKRYDDIKNQGAQGAVPDAFAIHNLRQDMALFSMEADMTIRGIAAGIYDYD